MTATEVTQATPAEGPEAASTSKESSPSKAKESSPSKAKESSPVKTKTPEQVKAEADTLIAVGKRDLLLNNVPDAVSNLAQACELLSKQFGETAKECAEVYFYYGKGLLELSRMESGVLGNALDGVPEEESENNTSQFEDPSKMSDQEKNEVTDNVSEALEENFKDLEEKKKATEEKKDAEKANEEKMDVEKPKSSEENKTSEEKKDEKMEVGNDTEATKVGEEKKTEEGSTDEKKIDDAPKDGEKKAEGEEAPKDSKAETTKEVKEGDESKDPATTEEKAEDEAMEEGTEDEEADGEESADEKMEETTDEKKDDEEPSNLQLAWEMLELAKVVYSKQLETAEDADKSHLLERLCSTMLALGEVSIENENYKQAVEDIQECLKKEETMPKDARIIAETHYQLGVAQGFHAQHDEAVESLKSAINIIQERIKNMEKVETEEAKKEVTELKALIPEIEEKIKDTQDMKKEAETKKEEGAASSGDAFGSSKVAEVKPVSNIAVKRKAEDEESSNKKIAADKETAAAS